MVVYDDLDVMYACSLGDVAVCNIPLVFIVECDHAYRFSAWLNSTLLLKPTAGRELHPQQTLPA